MLTVHKCVEMKGTNPPGFTLVKKQWVTKGFMLGIIFIPPYNETHHDRQAILILNRL
jgi:hypothetical protein